MFSTPGKTSWPVILSEAKDLNLCVLSPSPIPLAAPPPGFLLPKSLLTAFVGTAFRGGPPSKFLASTTTLSFRATRGLRVRSVPAIPNLTGSAGILAGSWAFSSTIYDSRTATHESRLTAFVGTAFRGGPPTQFLSSQQLRHSEQREESLFAFPNSQLTNHNLRITKAVNSN